MLHRSILVVATSAALASATHGAPLWGTRTEAGLGDMFSNFGQNNFTIDTDGPLDPVEDLPIGGAPAEHSLVDDAVQKDSRGTGPWNRGTAEAMAALNLAGGAQPAILRARSILTGNVSDNVFNGQPAVDAAATSLAFASDQFAYLGTSPSTQSITFTLTGTLNNSPSDPSGQTGVFAFIDVFPSLNYAFTTDRGSLIFELHATPLDSESVSIVNGTTFNRVLVLTFNVSPGDTIFVRQSLAAWAAIDTHSADAYSTLTSSFAHPELFQSQAVPEPALPSLLAVSLAALALARRRSPRTPR
jgi:hypothetical protein